MTYLRNQDNTIYELIQNEAIRQKDLIELIASENFVSNAVLEAAGSILTNKYAEGYPSKRYYNGCHYVDEIENIAIERAKTLFKCNYANVQPHSGSQANQAAFLALLKPGDRILGMSMNSGGHLTHGSQASLSGKWFESISYNVNKSDFLIDYDSIESLAIEYKPKLIIAGYSAYPREIDFAKFRKIADKVGAYLMADIAHIAGLVATGYHQSPLEYADVVTSTTHKTLRGPRGGLILSNNEDLFKKIDLALFPGIQGGPLMHIIAAKAVAFGEALQPSFSTYIKQVLKNAKALSDGFKTNGYHPITDGTSNHMVILDLRNQGITGKDAANALDRAGITCNKNNIPFDDTSPFITSGIRLGSAACTTRGFKEHEFKLVADMISEVLDGLKTNTINNDKIEQEVLAKVKNLCSKF